MLGNAFAAANMAKTTVREERRKKNPSNNRIRNAVSPHRGGGGGRRRSSSATVTGLTDQQRAKIEKSRARFRGREKERESEKNKPPIVVFSADDLQYGLDMHQNNHSSTRSVKSGGGKPNAVAGFAFRSFMKSVKSNIGKATATNTTTTPASRENDKRKSTVSSKTTVSTRGARGINRERTQQSDNEEDDDSYDDEDEEEKKPKIVENYPDMVNLPVDEYGQIRLEAERKYSNSTPRRKSVDDVSILTDDHWTPDMRDAIDEWEEDIFAKPKKTKDKDNHPMDVASGGGMTHTSSKASIVSKRTTASAPATPSVSSSVPSSHNNSGSRLAVASVLTPQSRGGSSNSRPISKLTPTSYTTPPPTPPTARSNMRMVRRGKEVPKRTSSSSSPQQQQQVAGERTYGVVPTSSNSASKAASAIAKSSRYNPPPVPNSSPTDNMDLHPDHDDDDDDETMTSDNDRDEHSNQRPLKPLLPPLDNSQYQQQNTLVTFQRRLSDSNKVVDTTIQIRPDTEETMSSVVKRLQSNKACGVLTFERSALQEIKSGAKRVVFVLPQIGSAKFAKEEFGDLATEDLLALTQQRPIVIEIQTEDAVEGETLDIF